MLHAHSKTPPQKEPAIDDTEPALRFLRTARDCRARDLAQLSVLGALVQALSELIHALQKERGAATIYLGSHGTRFGERLGARVADSQALEQQVRERFSRIDEQLDRLSSGARFYTRLALAFRALDTLPDTRARITALAAAPKDAVHTFSQLIASLLAVGLEAADVAADADTSRALIALVNFARGKEYAGQERAVAGGALSAGALGAEDCRELEQIVAAQTRAFEAFAQFAPAERVAAFQALAEMPPARELAALRATLFGAAARGPLPAPEAWYELTTRRIDRMKSLEDELTADIGRRCAQLLGAPAEETGALPALGAIGLLVNDRLEGGGWYSSQQQPMKPIREVVEAQSRRIDAINGQLETARTALVERKLVERAKGLLMRGRRLSEKDAYTLLRQTAMSQNKRLFEVAEAVIKALQPGA